MKFILPLEALPEDMHERYQKLHDYFCDQRAHSYQENGKWIVEPYWPLSKEYFVDPLIEEGFRWWQPDLTLDKGYQQVRNMNGYQLSLHDSWTLYSWSKWLAEEVQTTDFPKAVIILHVDHHNDLMSPRLKIANDQLIDLLIGSTFDISKPESVKSAILSGAVGVGSFMVPFLYTVSRVHIRHLCDSHLTQRYAHVNLLKRTQEIDNLLAVNQPRPAVTFQRNEQQNITGDIINYKVTDQTDEWLKNLPDAPVLLHIDMDYFNCRYDGDSDWQNNLNRYDPEQSIMNEKMNQISRAIAENGLGKQVKDVTVALSPGFYPVEFWEEGVDKISKFILSMV